jgi:hypothetical protein
MDTSVIGGYLDKEFSTWTVRLFKEFKNGGAVAIVSDLTLRELERAPAKIKQVLNVIPSGAIEYIQLTKESEMLAETYIRDGVIGVSHYIDAQHIALATVAKVDILVSWNFRHIVNLELIRAFNAVNLKHGHHVLEIRSPREVVKDEEGL